MDGRQRVSVLAPVDASTLFEHFLVQFGGSREVALVAFQGAKIAECRDAQGIVLTVQGDVAIEGFLEERRSFDELALLLKREREVGLRAERLVFCRPKVRGARIDSRAQQRLCLVVTLSLCSSPPPTRERRCKHFG